MPLDVRPFSIAELKSLLKEKSEASEARINSKLHSNYFENYFSHGDIAAQTIVVQDDYIDRDYLEDFASYYVRCFRPYKSHCARLHFFKNTFTPEQLEKLIVGEEDGLTQKDLQDNYVGFMVVRPLPKTIIGRTCLRTYGSDGGRRKYPITREYSASLFGIPLTIDTLGFQEQDAVAGACATSALWSILQGTGKTFQHAIPSSAAISNLAERHLPKEARKAPSRGLTDDQALTVIRSVDLEPLQLNVSDEFTLQSSAYAYLRGNIPLYLGVSLFNVTIGGANADEIDGDTSSPVGGSGGHAIAVTGVSLGRTSETPQGDFRLRASKIDKIYAHDDQVGPFARMELKQFTIKYAGKPDSKVFALTSSFQSEFPGQDVVALPEELIVPLYHKIRIPYQFVQGAVLAFDAVMKRLLTAAAAGYDESKFTWDITLVTGSGYIDFQRQRADIDKAHRFTLATIPLPRFYWQASLYYDASPAMTVIFDATDLEQGDVVVHILEEDAGYCGAARKLAATDQTKTDRELFPDWRIWNWLRKP
jgi:hypothetical protein